MYVGWQIKGVTISNYIFVYAHIETYRVSTIHDNLFVEWEAQRMYELDSTQYTGQLEEKCFGIQSMLMRLLYVSCGCNRKERKKQRKKAKVPICGADFQPQMLSFRLISCEWIASVNEN